jgi:hypothetical protein
MMSSRCPFPSVSDVRAVWGAGPDGASLANRWMDALIAGISHSTASFAVSQAIQMDNVTPAALFERRPALSATDPERFGWRFWALRPDGVLVTPFAGTEVTSGTINAQCRACVDPPSPDCVCGIHYMQRARDIIAYAEGSLRLPSRIFALQHILDGEWLPALTYGVAVGAVEVDRCEYQNPAAPSWRAARWQMLALLAPGAGPELRASLRERYGCKVLSDASLAACDAVAARLEASVSPAKMAELASLRG